MDIEKLIEDLRGLLKQYGEKIPYGELVGAPWPYSRAGDLVWQDPEPYFIEQAATALSTFQAENEKLRSEAEGMRSNWYKSVEEIQKLRAELEQAKAERDAAIKDLNEFLTMDELCPIQCEWCKWNDTFCDGKTPEWRGQKEG